MLSLQRKYILLVPKHGVVWRNSGGDYRPPEYAQTLFKLLSHCPLS